MGAIYYALAHYGFSRGLYYTLALKGSLGAILYFGTLLYR
jgi:hypothetical protein